MATDLNNNYRSERASENISFSEAFPAFPALMRKVYVWMAFALLITGMTAYLVAATPEVVNIIVSNSFLFFGLLIAELLLVVCISMALHKLTLAQATLLFIVYALINGITMSFLLLLYTEESISTVFLITAGTFGIMSLWGYTTGTDLSSMGKLLTMALIGLILATIVNVFLQNSTMMLIISYVGVIVFVGLTTYDTQKIKVMLSEANEENEEYQKIALLGALSLYLDFINLFIYLLRIFGSRK